MVFYRSQDRHKSYAYREGLLKIGRRADRPVVRFGNVEVRPLGGGFGCLLMILVSILLSVVLTVIVNLVF